MFTITLRRPFVTLAITAGLLVAVGPVSASQAAPPPPHPEVKGQIHGKSSKHRSTRLPTGGPAPLSYALSDSMISGYS